MVHIKDVFAYVGRPEAFQLEGILRRPLLVAPQMPVLDLLLQMRQARMHLALVVDEYGGIDGLVTIEDLVETIVGDISDEHDEVHGPMVTERGDGSLDLDARLPVEDFEARLGPVLTEDEREADIDTVGGLVFTLAGRVPARGEVIGHPSGFEFRVLDADARRIRRLRVRRTPQDGQTCSSCGGRGSVRPPRRTSAGFGNERFDQFEHALADRSVGDPVIGAHEFERFPAVKGVVAECVLRIRRTPSHDRPANCLAVHHKRWREALAYRRRRS